MCDWLSRTDFDVLLGDTIGELARDAFSRMDQQLDLSLQQLLSLESAIYVCADMYLQSQFSDLWKKLEEFQAILLPMPKIGKNTERKILDFSSKPKNTFSVKENFLSHMHICTAFCNGATQQMVIPHRIEPFSFSSSLSLPPDLSRVIGHVKVPFWLVWGLSPVKTKHGPRPWYFVRPSNPTSCQ